MEIETINITGEIDRKDGRENNQIQNLVMKTVQKQTGKHSIYLETSYIKCLTTAEGPLYNQGFESSNYLKVVVKLNLPLYSTNNISPSEKTNIENVIENLLRKNILLEKYSKGLLKIKIDVLEYSSDILHYCLMSAVTALLNLGIEQKGIITCSNIIVNSNNNIIIDPSFEEEKKSKVKFQIACLVDLEEVVLLISNGSLNSNTLKVKELMDNKNKNTNNVNTNTDGCLINNEVFNDLLVNSLQICKVYHNYIIKLLN